MAEAKSHAARRPISRTYEGVQWFRHADGWRASIPGTPMSVLRWKSVVQPDETIYMRVEVHNGTQFVQVGGYTVRNHPYALLREELPWTITTAESVRDASDLVKHLRQRIAFLTWDWVHGEVSA